MTKFLVNKCRYCKNVIRIKTENGVIKEVIGAHAFKICVYKKKLKLYVCEPSSKTLICDGSNIPVGYKTHCGRGILVSKFKEIIP